MTKKRRLGCLHVLLAYALGYTLYGGGLWIAAAYAVEGGTFEEQPLITLIGGLLSVIGLGSVVIMPGILSGFERSTQTNKEK
jgi:hypothetical protein